jgi:hypothetical protein
MIYLIFHSTLANDLATAALFVIGGHMGELSSPSASDLSRKILDSLSSGSRFWKLRADDELVQKMHTYRLHWNERVRFSYVRLVLRMLPSTHARQFRRERPRARRGSVE